MIELRPCQYECIEAIGGRQRNARKSDAAILKTYKLPLGRCTLISFPKEKSGRSSRKVSCDNTAERTMQ